MGFLFDDDYDVRTYHKGQFFFNSYSEMVLYMCSVLVWVWNEMRNSVYLLEYQIYC